MNIFLNGKKTKCRRPIARRRLHIILRKIICTFCCEISRQKYASATKNQQIIDKISGAIRMGRKIAGVIFAVFTFVMPSMFVPIRIMISEPVTDI